jgi:hypothetical protein
MDRSPSAIRDSAALVLMLHLIGCSWSDPGRHYPPAAHTFSSLLRHVG